MKRLKLEVATEELRLRVPFHISGHVFEAQPAVIVTLDDGSHRGRGEASGVYYLNDNMPEMVAAIEANRAAIEAGIDRDTLQTLMPPGGARNAVDCALWDLDAHRSGNAAWRLAGIAPPKPLVTTFTLGADAPEVMAEGARNFADARAIKMKLTGDLDLDIARVRAVRAARPTTWLGVDANQGYTIASLDKLLAALVDAKVALVEQPLARGREADLDDIYSPIPLAADESVLGLADLPSLIGRFHVVNIKLDKCGGLTEGLKIAHAAREMGFKVMVGNMVGTSWAMAPAFIVGQLCDIVDLDGPIFLARDRTPGLRYEDGLAWCDDQVWGSTHAAVA